MASTTTLPLYDAVLLHHIHNQAALQARQIEALSILEPYFSRSYFSSSSFCFVPAISLSQ